jgi:ADP-ribose pyrophosphatase
MKKVNTKELYKGPAFTVKQYKLQNEAGQEIIRDIVEKKPVVIILAHNTDTNTVVVGKEFRSGSFKDEISFPAGFIDEGEKPEDAAIREAEEETGFIPYKTEYLGSGYSSPGFTNEFSHFFYCQVKGEPGEQKLDHDEAIERMEIPFEDLADLFRNGEITSCQAKACYLQYLLKR